MTPVALAWRYFELLGDGRLEEAAALLDDDGTWWTCGGRREMPMTDHKARFPRAMQQVPMRFTFRTAIAEGSTVLLELESHATMPDGNTYENVYAFVIEIVGDRIGAVREYNDSAYVRDRAPSLSKLYSESAP